MVAVRSLRSVRVLSGGVGRALCARERLGDDPQQLDVRRPAAETVVVGELSDLGPFAAGGACEDRRTQLAGLDLVEQIVGRLPIGLGRLTHGDRLVQPHEITRLEKLPQLRLVGAARPRRPQIGRRFPAGMQLLEPARLHLDPVGSLLPRIFAQRGLIDRARDRRSGDHGAGDRGHSDPRSGTNYPCKHDGALIFTATSDSNCSVEE
jgi:hypothetical protein